MLAKYSSNYTTTSQAGISLKVLSVIRIIENKLIANPDNDAFNTNVGGTKIIGVVGDDETIPIFNHPVFNNGKTYIDARAFVNRTGQIKDNAEYKYLLKRAMLERLWNTEHDMFIPHQEFICDVFATWVASGLTRSFGLTEIQKTQFRIALAIYYTGIFNVDHELPVDVVASRMIVILSRALKLPGSLIDDMFTDYEEELCNVYLYNSEDDTTIKKLLILCNVLTSITNEVNKITPAVIYTAACNGAFTSANSNEIAMIAIEHPPALVNMMHYVLLGGFQSKQKVGQATDSVSKRHNAEAFKSFMKNIFGKTDE